MCVEVFRFYVVSFILLRETVNILFSFTNSRFGTEYGRECYCGNEVREGSNKVLEIVCSFNCPGDVTQRCGSGLHLTTYALTGTIPPQVDAPPATSKYIGCHTEATTGLALKGVGFSEKA